MRTLEMIRQVSQQAQAGDGVSFLTPDGITTVPGTDPRWRPFPDPTDGSLVVDPGFTLPTVAGPLSWQLFFDSSRASQDSEYGWGRSASFPLRLVQSGSNVTVMHEDGTIRQYAGSAGVYTATGALNGDKLVTQTDNTWDETLGADAFLYHFPAGSYVSLLYRATPQGQRITYNYVGGQLQSVEDPAGRRITLAYNADGKVQTIEDWGNRGLVVMTYVGSDLQGLWRQEGEVTSYAYDSTSHKLTSITDPEGYQTTYTYDGSGRVATRSVAGNLERYTYTADGATGYTDPLGRTWTHLTSGGYPSGMIDPLGNRETYTYVNNKPLEFENALGNKTSFAYDANGFFLAARDALGNRTTFQRDSYGNITSLTNALGSVMTLTYGTHPEYRQVEQVIDPLGRRTTIGYHSNGLPQYVVDRAGYRTTYGWDAVGVLVSLVNAAGFLWTFTYNAIGNRTSILDPLGQRSTYTYDKLGRLTGEQNPLGFINTMVYDTRGLLTALIDPLGYRTTYQWDATGQLTEVIDAFGYRWTTVYDAADEITAGIDPLGYRTSLYYDLAGRVTVVEDALGYRSTLTYDADGQLISAIDPLGYRRTWNYDALGRVSTSVDARGNITTRVYDAVGQVVSLVNALGSRFDIVYDQASEPLALIDQMGYRTTFSFDARGLLESVQDPSTDRTTYGYDPLGLRQSTQDATGQSWTAVYDTLARVQARIDPLGSRISTVYDASSRPIALVDGRGNRWTQSYDARDLVVGQIDPLGRRVSYGYDAVGQLVTWTNARSEPATYTYSSRGEITVAEYADGTRVTYGHDAAGRVATVVDAAGRYTMTYTPRGELSSVQAPQHPAGQILTYTYDGVGNRTLISSWLGPQTMLYDVLDRNTVMYDPDGHITTWTFDARSQVTRQDNWNGTTTTWTYDSRGLVTGIRHTQGGSLLTEAYYTWDAVKQPIKRVTGGGTTTWVYDTARQLKSEWHEVGVITTWTYDPSGNRSQQQRHQGGILTTTDYRYDVANQLVTLVEGTAITTFGYDLNGNIVTMASTSGSTTYIWDPLDRLTKVQAPLGVLATYTYRHDGLRSTVDQGEGRLSQVWDAPGFTGFGDLIEEVKSGGDVKRAYYRGPRLATIRDDTPQSLAVALDHLGSAQLLTDGTIPTPQVKGRFQWGAWGELLSGASLPPLSWLGNWGYYRDGAQRTWVRERHLDVGLGRWLSKDPLGISPRADFYDYVENQPVRAMDPTGLANDPGPQGKGVTRIAVDFFIPGKSAGGGMLGDDRPFLPNDQRYRYRASFEFKLYPDGLSRARIWPGLSRAWFIANGEWPIDTTPLHFDVPKYLGRGKWLLHICGAAQFPGPASYAGWLQRELLGPVVPQHDTDLAYGLKVLPVGTLDTIQHLVVPRVDFDLWLLVRPDGVWVTGRHDTYPAFEVWKYTDNTPPSLKYGYDHRWIGASVFGVAVRDYIGIQQNKALLYIYDPVMGRQRWRPVPFRRLQRLEK